MRLLAKAMPAALLASVLPPATYAAAAADPAPIVFTPAGPWEIDYEDTTCGLRRRFVSGANEAILEIRAPAPYLKIRVASSKLAEPDKQVPTFTAFSPGENGKTRVAATTGRTATGVPVVMLEPVPLVETWLRPFGADPAAVADWPLPTEAQIDAALATVRELHVTRGTGELVLRHGPLKTPLAELTKCQQAKQDALAAELGNPMPAVPPVPKGNQAKWVGPDDYPIKSFVESKNGIVAVRLIVGADGKPAKCITLNEDSPEDFRKTVCALLMKRARFNPALDANGQPVRGFFATSIRFWIPGS